MTTTEIKAAWNTFKKEISKQTSFNMTGCCYMTAKQIANGTATICLCIDIEYDVKIAMLRASIEQVNGYDTWTTEKKKNSEARNLEKLAHYENLKNTYGTRANEAKTKAAEITTSAAFQKLAQTIGIKSTDWELTKDQYQIRVHY